MSACSDQDRRGRAKTASDIARELGPVFASVPDATTNEDEFVADNFAMLKTSGLVEAGVPTEFGGGGADVDELSAMLRTLAHHCGSTALAFSMHTHQVAIPAWRWKYQKAAAVEPLLKRMAQERILLMSSGGSDWIGGSGKAEKVDGGYRITARKDICVGRACRRSSNDRARCSKRWRAADCAAFRHSDEFTARQVLDNWRTLGMRGTGSHDVLIEGHVVPEAAVAGRRKAGEWHPLFHIIATIAFPLVYSVYLGVAESARDIGCRHGEKEKAEPTRRPSRGPHGNGIDGRAAWS